MCVGEDWVKQRPEKSRETREATVSASSLLLLLMHGQDSKEKLEEAREDWVIFSVMVGAEHTQLQDLESVLEDMATLEDKV